MHGTNATMRADLAAVRQHAAPYDAEAGAARLAAALGTAAAAATVAAVVPSLLSAGGARLLLGKASHAAVAVLLGAGTLGAAALFAPHGSQQAAPVNSFAAAGTSALPSREAPSRAEPSSRASSAPSALATSSVPASPDAPAQRLAAPVARSETGARTPPGRSIREELREVAALKQLLSTHPSSVLAGLDERPPARGDVLGEERAILAIEALISLGREEEARARARAFLAGHPGSAYGERARALIGGAR